MSAVHSLLNRYRRPRPVVGATAALESIRPGSNARVRFDLMQWVFRYSGWYLVLAAAGIAYLPFPNKRTLPEAGVDIVLIAYSIYTLTLELMSRARNSSYDTSFFRGLRIAATLATVTLLVALDRHAGSYFWFFFLLPALQAFIYFRRRGLIAVMAGIVAIYVGIMLGATAPGRPPVDYTVVGLNTSILVFASLVLSGLFKTAQDQQILQYLAELQTISRTVIEQLSVQDALQVTLEKGMRAIGASGGSIMLWDSRDQKLHIEAWIAADGRVDTNKRHRTFASEEGIAGAVYATGQPINVPDVFNARKMFVESATGRPIGSVLAVPIISGAGHTLGTISADSPERYFFQRKEEEFLGALGRFVGTAVEVDRLRTVTTALSTLRVDDVLERVVEAAAALTQADSATIFLKRPGSATFERKVRFPRRPDTESPRPSGGLTEAVMHTGTILITDATNDPRVRESVKQEGIRSILGVPLAALPLDGSNRMGRVSGVLFVNSNRLGLFTPRDKDLLTGLAGHAAVAIDNAELYADTQWQLSQLETLHQVSTELQLQRTLPELFDAISRCAGTLLNADSAAIFLKDESSDELRIKGAHGLTRETMARTRIRVGESIAGLVARDGVPIICRDVEADRRATNPFLKEEGIRSLMTVPLKFGGETIGTLGVHSRSTTDAFETKHARILELLASQAVAAVRNVAEVEQIRRQAGEATGLRALYHASMNLTRPQSMRDLIQLILDTAVKTLAAQGGGLYLYDEPERECSLKAVNGEIAEVELGRRLPLTMGVVGYVITNNMSLAVPDYSNWPNRAVMYDDYKIRAAVGAPISWEGRVIGAIVVHTHAENRTFTKEDQGILSLLGTFAAVALQSARHADDYERLFNSSLEAIIVIDENGTVIRTNPRAAQIFGASSDQLLHRQVRELYSSAAEAERIKKLLVEGGGRIEDNEETSIRSLDGEVIPISLSAALLRDFENKRAGSVGFFRDLREIKRAAREIQLLQSALSASRAITGLGDRKTVLQDVVDNAARAMSATRVVLWPFGDGRVQRDARVSSLATSRELASEGFDLPDTVLESIIAHHDEAVAWSNGQPSHGVDGSAAMEWLACCLRVGERPIGVMACFFNAEHGFIKWERDVFRLFADVAAIAIANADHATELETAAYTSALAAWSAMIAHDLHDEAALIRGHVAVLRMRPDLPDDVKARLAAISAHAEAMLLPTDRTVKIGANLVECVQQEIASAAICWPDVSWRITAGAERPMVAIGAWWLRRMLHQFFLNASKELERSSGSVREVLVSVRQENGAAFCSIRDSGQGLPKEIERQAFRTLIKRDNSVSRGLLGVRTVLEQYGGSVRLAENTPSGACFEIRMPVVAAAS